MADELLPFERITQALANLSWDELRSLVKAVDELIRRLGPTLAGQQFKAEGLFFEERSAPSITLDEMLQLINALNPAELTVLSSLIPYYFDGMRHYDGQRVSATWGSPSTHLRFLRVVRQDWLLPEDVSQDDIQQRFDLANSIRDLVQSAQQAKAAGDQQKVSELFEQAMSVLKDHGFSGSQLETLRNLFHDLL